MLLDEVCKIFERIIVSRLVRHMTRVGPDLADNQFVFRHGRSTVYAIMRVKVLAEEAVARGEVVLSVSLDIANAFNTLPSSTIREALRYRGTSNSLTGPICRKDRWCTRVGKSGVAHIVDRIRRLGLEVALHKSEALSFHGARMKPPGSNGASVWCLDRSRHAGKSSARS